LANLYFPDWHLFGQNLDISKFQFYNQNAALVLFLNPFSLCETFLPYAVKKHPTVLANPYFPDWHLFGQNPDTQKFSVLQSKYTAGAISKSFFSL